MKLDWRQAILYATIAGMEGCWLFALMVLLNKQVTGERLSVLGILTLYPVAFAFNMVLQRLRLPKGLKWSMSWLGWAVATILVIKIQLFGNLPLSDPAWLTAIPKAIADMIYVFKPELLILISTAVLWWLGRRLAFIANNFSRLVGEFQFGLIMLIITFLAASQLNVTLANPIPLILSFFLFALVGISVAHALESTSWLSGLYQGHWSGLLLISISLILILGLLISSIVTPDLLQLFWAALKWVLGLLIKVITFLVSLLPEPEPAELPPPIPDMPALAPGEDFQLWTMPETVRSALRIVWTVLMSALFLFALWRISSEIFNWLRRKLASTAGAEFEPLPGAFRKDLLGLLKRIIRRLVEWRLAFRRKASANTEVPGVAFVRQIYRQLLHWAAANGYPRHVSQTPYEYCYTLVSLLPEVREDLEAMTQEYVRMRYGTSVPSEEELHQLDQTWHRVKQNRLKR